MLAGSNLKLLLHVLEACFRAKIVPSDLEALLNHLHATEPKPPDGASSNSSTGSSSGGGNGTTAVQYIVYTCYICVCVGGESKGNTFFLSAHYEIMLRHPYRLIA